MLLKKKKKKKREKVERREKNKLMESGSYPGTKKDHHPKHWENSRKFKHRNIKAKVKQSLGNTNTTRPSLTKPTMLIF